MNYIVSSVVAISINRATVRTSGNLIMKPRTYVGFVGYFFHQV